MEGKTNPDSMNSMCIAALKVKAAALYDMTTRLNLGTPCDVSDYRTLSNSQIQARMAGLIINALKLPCRIFHHQCRLFLSHLALQVGGSHKFTALTTLLFRQWCIRVSYTYDATTFSMQGRSRLEIRSFK